MWKSWPSWPLNKPNLTYLTKSNKFNLTSPTNKPNLTNQTQQTLADMQLHLLTGWNIFESCWANASISTAMWLVYTERFPTTLEAVCRSDAHLHNTNGKQWMPKVEEKWKSNGVKHQCVLVKTKDRFNDAMAARVGLYSRKTMADDPQATLRG